MEVRKMVRTVKKSTEQGLKQECCKYAWHTGWCSRREGVHLLTQNKQAIDNTQRSFYGNQRFL